MKSSGAGVLLGGRVRHKVRVWERASFAACALMRRPFYEGCGLRPFPVSRETPTRE